MTELFVPALTPSRFFAGDQPELRGLGLGLRAWRPADWRVLVHAYENPEIRRWHVRTLREQEARGWADLRAREWRERLAVDWAVTDEAGAVLGRIGIRRFEFEKALGEVAYWVLPEARGDRVTSRALELVCEWAFARQGMHRIEIAHSVANEPSCRVAVRSGFALEGTKRAELWHADGWHDMHLHARLSDDPVPGE